MDLNGIRKRISTQASLLNCDKSIQKVVDNQLGTLLGDQYGKKSHFSLFAKGKSGEQASVPKGEN